MTIAAANPVHLFARSIVVASLLGCVAEGPVDPTIEPAPSLKSLNAEATFDSPVAVSSELVPALAFVQGPTFELVQPTFEGALPGSFTFDLDELPPQVAAQRILLDGEPVAVVALFAAIARDREAELANRPVLRAGGGCATFDDGTSTCVIDAAWCLSDQTTCYVEHYDCTHDGWLQTSDDTSIRSEAWQHSRELFNVDTQAELVRSDGCTLQSTEGDAGLREPVESYLVFAQNHWLLHLQAPAPAGSVTSYLMGERGSIPAGYSVIELDRASETSAQADARQACEQAARADAAQQISQAHGVSLNDADFALDTCEHGVSICDEAMTASLQARAKRACPLPGYTARRVVDADLTTLDLTFGSDPVYPW